MQNYPTFVEGRLTAVAVDDQEKTIEISVIDSTKTRFIFRLEGLEELLVDELRQTNIIESIKLWGAFDDSDEYHGVLSWLISGKDDNAWASQYDSVIREVELLIKTGNRVLLLIEPVYGATVLALARACSLVPLDIDRH